MCCIKYHLFNKVDMFYVYVLDNGRECFMKCTPVDFSIALLAQKTVKHSGKIDFNFFLQFLLFFPGALGRTCSSIFHIFVNQCCFHSRALKTLWANSRIGKLPLVKKKKKILAKYVSEPEDHLQKFKIFPFWQRVDLIVSIFFSKIGNFQLSILEYPILPHNPYFYVSFRYTDWPCCSRYVAFMFCFTVDRIYP